MRLPNSFQRRLRRQLPREAGRPFGSYNSKKADQLIADPLGAENETRTRDPNLGKVVLYQLSYFRIIFFENHALNPAAPRHSNKFDCTRLAQIFRIFKKDLQPSSGTCSEEWTAKIWIISLSRKKNCTFQFYCFGTTAKNSRSLSESLTIL